MENLLLIGLFVCLLIILGLMCYAIYKLYNKNKLLVEILIRHNLYIEDLDKCNYESTKVINTMVDVMELKDKRLDTLEINQLHTTIKLLEQDLDECVKNEDYIKANNIKSDISKYRDIIDQMSNSDIIKKKK